MSKNDSDLKSFIEKILNAMQSGSASGRGAQSSPLKQWGAVIFGILLILAAYKSFYTVEPDEEAVVVRFGRYLQTTQPGLHPKIPWVDKVYKVQSKRRQEEVFGFRRSSAGTKRSNQEESLMLSGDLNLADVQWMVQYEISDPWKYLFRVKDVPTTIRDVSMSVMRRVVGDESVSEVLTTGRAAISVDVRDLMQETLDQYDAGIRIVTVELQSVTPPDQVKPAFNDVNAAKQEQESAINQAEREYNRVIPQAKGLAEQTIAEAEAYAIKVVNQAKGDSDNFRSIMKEYKKAPVITRYRMFSETMEKVLSNIDSFTLVDKDSKGLLPVHGSIATQKIPDSK